MNTRTKAFSESERGITLRNTLLEMVENKLYNTATSYSTTDANGLSFVEKHMKYMSQYPNLNCEQYISNLKLMSKRGK